MNVLDTSDLIRYFTNDIPTEAEKIKKLIESKEKLYIPDVVFVELERFLMSKSYRSTRQKIFKSFKFLITKSNIQTSKQMHIAIDLYASNNLDMTDCIVEAFIQK